MCYVGSFQVVVSGTSLLVLWMLLSCSDVCLGSSLVVAWCSSLVVLCLILICLESSSELRQGTQNSSQILVVLPL